MGELPKEMVKLEYYNDIEDDSSDVEVLVKDFPGAGPSDLMPSSSTVYAKEKDLASSSCGHLKSYFIGMGFSPTLVEKVIEENDDENLILEALVNYSKSSPIATTSLDGFSSPDGEEDNSPIELATDDNEEIEEVDAPSAGDVDKRSSLIMMNFTEEEVDWAINRLGKDVPLAELVDFIIAAQTTGCSADKEMNGAANDYIRKNEEASADTLFWTMDKTLCLLKMGFTEDEVSSAIDNFGPQVPICELADSIFASQIAHRVDEGEDLLNDRQKQNQARCPYQATIEYSEPSCASTEEANASYAPFHNYSDKKRVRKVNHMAVDYKTVTSRSRMKQARQAEDKAACWTSAAAYNDLGDLVVSDMDLLNDRQKQNQARCPDQATIEYSEPSCTSTEVTNASYAPFHNYSDKKRVRKVDHMAVDYKTTTSRSRMKQARLAEDKAACWTSAAAYNGLEDLVGSEMIKEEVPDETIPIPRKNIHGNLSPPPYFFYGNVVDVPQEMWQRLSQFLYGIEPEHLNTQFFSAFIRKEGYFHNLPTENRFHVLPKPPMTIEDALPHTKRWWLSWDTRKQLSSINSDTTGVGRLCDRLGNMMAESKGLLSKEQQMDIIHQCKASNLIWVGQNKLSPIESYQVECILGYPMQHTQISGLEPSDRLRALKYSYQTDTLGYHLSVLKNMYPDGLRVLSVYSGIGGAEVALHRLGIHLKYVVSVEESEVNHKILRRWWDNSRQSGVLLQVGSVEMLTIQKLESYLDQFGGFDIIIGHNPGTCVSGNSSRGSSVGLDVNQFFEFVRVYQRVRSVLAR